MRPPRQYAVLLLLPLTLPLGACGGCGGDDGVTDDGPDAEVQPDSNGATVCPSLAEPQLTIDSYPATVSGSVQGEGADLAVEQGICEVEALFLGEFYPVTGEDAAVALTGLQPGAEYVVVLDAPDDDLGFYVVTGCDPATSEIAAGQCILFDDQSLGGERNLFTAPAGGEAWIVVDTTQ
jgi:hypothetical protein